MTTSVSIGALRPTQLYLSSEKLASVIEWFDFAAPKYDPLPVFTHQGHIYLADGHTRAFVAHLAGEQSVPVDELEDIRSEYDFTVYRQCIEWCRDAGVDSVADFRGRILDPTAYEERWLKRCQRLTE